MAYKPNPDRKVVNGKAVVSAKELADFQAERGSDKTLRDLLNADKGLSRKKESEELPKTTDANVRMSRQSGPPTTTQDATYPKKEAASKQKADDSGPSEMVKGFRAARDKFGDTPFVDALMSAGKAGIAMEGGKLLGPAGRALGAAAKKMVSEDGLLPTFNRAEDPRPTTFSTLKPENQAVSRQYREAYDDRPGPMKKGGAVKPYTKGGKINLGACGVSTHVPSKKNANW
jgi:hypothetical protein